MELHDVPVLAFGTAGAQGSGLIEALTARGARPVRASSRRERVEQWRAEGHQAVRADLSRPETVAEVAGDVGAAVLHMPLSMGGSQGAATVVASVRTLRDRGLPVAVNIGTVVPPEGVPDVMGGRALAEALSATGATTLTPTGYLENHAAPWATASIARGELVYPRPKDDRVAWIAARDMTAAAVAAVAMDAGDRLLRLAGPQALTFDELAAELGAGIEAPLTFRRLTPAEYADLLRPFLGDAAAAGVEAGYSSMPEEPNPLMAPDAGPVWAELGVTPTPARQWAAQVLRPQLGQ